MITRFIRDDEFDIWFKFYLRRLGMSYAAYAEHIGTDERSIKYMAEGKIRPTSRILQDINATYEERRQGYYKWKMKV